MTSSRSTALRLVRESHEERVLTALRARGPLERAELGQVTGLSRTTLSAIVRALLATDAVVEVRERSTTARSRGRPASRLALNPSGALAVGLDLAHRRTHVVIANVAHDIVASATVPCRENEAWAKRVRTAADLINDIAEKAGISLARLGGIGVGVIGPTSEATGQPNSSTSDRAEQAYRTLADRFGVPVHTDNNTRLAALAESIWGAGAGVQNVLYVRLSYGVGGGLILDGHLFSGFSGGAGELGHVPVDPEGPSCRCGGRGCFQQYASIGAVLERCRTRRLDEVLRRVAEEEPRALQVIADVGARLGRVLAVSCNVVNPEVLIVGGELAGAGDALLAPTWTALNTHAHRHVRRGIRLHVAELGEVAAARGGVALTLRESALLADYPGGTHTTRRAAGSHRPDRVAAVESVSPIEEEVR